ncbi:MAG TPA: aspartate:alanine exchanger family transporter [Polyangiaceae bacterium]|nr:aspartate:alanine exchanger family transporter [Polyangiaceae bacterium]
MLEFLHKSPLLILFGVIATGYLVGKLRVFGFALGVAAVLFAGLLLGALVPSIELPEFVPQFGLVLFVYTLGLASGPGFFSSLRLRGLRDNGLTLLVLTLSCGLTLALSKVFHFGGAAAAGLFSGAITNTPALAAVVEALKSSSADAKLLAAPVIAYSVCYPMGVFVPLIGVWLADRLFGVSFEREPISLSYARQMGERIVNRTVKIEHSPSACARELRTTDKWTVNFGRIQRGAALSIVHDETVFHSGDLVTVIGREADVLAAAKEIGSIASEPIDLDRSQIDYRRMFLSNSDVAGRPLSELHLTQRFDAVVTRVRRGDVDLVPTDTFVLELGDRVRVLAPKDRMSELEKLFGDSLRHVSEIDVITFSLGIALGLLLGSIPVPLPSGGTFKLGVAGGPLIVGLILGRVGRTGPLLWISPFGANLTLRQLGLVLFLAGVGLRAGKSFGETLAEGNVLPLMMSGALVTLTSAFGTLVIGHKVMRIPLNVLVGTLAGLHTQPAVLAFGLEKSGKDLPNVGYTSVYPFATIAKIVLAQVIIQLLH